MTSSSDDWAKKAADVRDDAAHKANVAADKVTDAASDLKSRADAATSDVKDRAGAQADHLKDKLSSKADDLTDSAKATGQNLRDSATSIATDLKSQASTHVEDAKGVMSSMADEARNRITGIIDQQKSMGADKLSGISKAAQNAASDLDEQNPHMAKLVRDAAGSVDMIAGNLRSSSLTDVITSVSSFARKQPVAFFAGSVIAGFALARFIKSEPTSPVADVTSRPQG